MARTIGEGINEGMAALMNARQIRMQAEQQKMNNLLTQAKIQEAGYQIGPGGQLSQRPDYVDLDKQLKQLKVKQLEDQQFIDPSQDLIPTGQEGIVYSKSQRKYIKTKPETEINFPFQFGPGPVMEDPHTSFNSPEEADSSGLEKGTIVLVQGRRYEI